MGVAATSGAGDVFVAGVGALGGGEGECGACLGCPASIVAFRAWIVACRSCLGWCVGTGVGEAGTGVLVQLAAASSENRVVSARRHGIQAAQGAMEYSFLDVVWERARLRACGRLLCLRWPTVPFSLQSAICPLRFCTVACRCTVLLVLAVPRSCFRWAQVALHGICEDVLEVSRVSVIQDDFFQQDCERFAVQVSYGRPVRPWSTALLYEGCGLDLQLGFCSLVPLQRFQVGRQFLVCHRELGVFGYGVFQPLDLFVKAQCVRLAADFHEGRARWHPGFLWLGQLWFMVQLDSNGYVPPCSTLFGHRWPGVVSLSHKGVPVVGKCRSRERRGRLVEPLEWGGEVWTTWW